MEVLHHSFGKSFPISANQACFVHPLYHTSHQPIGADRILFGADVPFEIEYGAATLRETIQSIDNMEIPKSDRKKIYEDNAKTLLSP